MFYKFKSFTALGSRCSALRQIHGFFLTLPRWKYSHVFAVVTTECSSRHPAKVGAL